LALEQYRRAKGIAEKAGDLFRLYIVKFMEGRACHLAGDLAQGSQLIEDSIALAAKLGTQFLLGQAKTFLGSCRLAEGRVDDAQSLCMEGSALAEKAGDRFTQSLARRGIAECLLAGAKDFDNASDLVRTAIIIQNEIGAKPELGRSWMSLGRIADMQGEEEQAACHFAKAMRLFTDLNMRWDSVQASQFEFRRQESNPSAA
jgi:tetratricopeptide (TPR) repeat protein